MSSISYNRILITGASGFLGHHIVPRIRENFAGEIFTPTRAQYDLLDSQAVYQMFRDFRPDCVVHLAAKSGGIIDNQQHPADYFYQNMAVNLHVFAAAQQVGIKKLVTFMGGCSYPSDAKSPIDEGQMWRGFPQVESAGYSVAKKTLLVQSWAYRKQHGLNSIVLIPGNVYGEWDNFNLQEAHVIPALIRKYVEATERGDPEITAFGTGKPTRDFVYAGDVAETVPWFIKHYDSSDPVNISTGRRISIRELAETIKTVTGFPGRIVWDASKPDGQMDKIFDVARLNQLGLYCRTSLHDGLTRTLSWFKQARSNGTVRL